MIWYAVGVWVLMSMAAITFLTREPSVCRTCRRTACICSLRNPSEVSTWLKEAGTHPLLKQEGESP